MPTNFIKESNLKPRDYHKLEHHTSRWESENVDHPSQSKAGFSPFPDRLYVVTAMFNPLRFRSRYEHYRTFEKMCQDAGAVLYTVECAFGDRPFEVTEPDDPYDIQLRTWSEIWHKERLLNIGVARIHDKHPNWGKVAWIDADVTFARPDWVQETLHQLEHYMWVQMFSHAQDLDPQWQPLLHAYDVTQTFSFAGSYQGYMYSYVNEIPVEVPNGYYYPGWPKKPLSYWHPGFSHACRREAFDVLGGLFDLSIAGNSDHLMCAALIGKVEQALPKGMKGPFKDALMEWQKRAEKYIQHDLGYVPGLLLHNWHGRKKDRAYVDRWKLLIDEKFDPNKDLKNDPQGLLQLTDQNWKLRDKMRLYLRARNEDSIDVE